MELTEYIWSKDEVKNIYVTTYYILDPITNIFKVAMAISLLFVI